ncbi:MAG TPA: hypothetical protein VHW00_07490 [Thermoanaerobaculia bacterium]|nr:hypothetical protein [Thermoanaerobaculia bacterium]
MKREEIIRGLREELLKFTTEDKSMCQAAAERGIFCRGFRQFGDAELRSRYWWLTRKFPKITRPQLETLANDWQLAQQDVRNAAISCDVQTKVHDTCGGWDDFTNEQLAVFYGQITGKQIEVT